MTPMTPTQSTYVSQSVGSGGDQSGASGTKGMADGKRSTPQVKLAHVHIPNLQDGNVKHGTYLQPYF
jgi:hypothetical protein